MATALGIGVAIGSLVCWATLAYAYFPEELGLPIWWPRHPKIFMIGVAVGIFGFLIRYMFPEPEPSSSWLLKFVIDLAPEMVGMAFTVVVIDELNQRSIEAQEKREIISQMRSPDSGIAIEALRLVREKERNWLKDGSLEGVDLGKLRLSDGDMKWAKLRGSKLRESRLERACLHGADLREATLDQAYLPGADLETAKLQRASLSHVRMDENTKLSRANFYGADFRWAQLGEVSFENCIICGANFSNSTLKNHNINGARYDETTVWSHHINILTAKAVKGKYDEQSDKWIPKANT